jgi:phage-related protein|tara:strand:- start:2291 stop:3325 length:1035 start_codon:yes stop_codon:yes gene_type:complete
MSDSSKNITKELLKMQPDSLLEFFEIDFSHLQEDFSLLEKRYKISFGTNSDPVYRFTSNINNSNPIYWQNKAYQPLPVDVSGLEAPSDGRLPRPTLRISNPSGILSSIVSSNYDFHGCKVTRRRTFAKFLDDVNFAPNSTSYTDADGTVKSSERNESLSGLNPFGGKQDSEAHLPDEVYYIHRKIVENRDSLEFEMTSILEVHDALFPGRNMLADHCSFRYRQADSCGYTGCPVENHKNRRFSEYGVYKFTNRGEWDTDNSYVLGDVVVYISKKEPAVPSHFVCVKDHQSPSPFPAISEEYWGLDSCGKTLDSCLKRFGDKATNSSGSSLRFGGFPSTENMKNG